jgi:hypothetical protein
VLSCVLLLYRLALAVWVHPGRWQATPAQRVLLLLLLLLHDSSSAE